jgi:predicted O-methyltransferase YrrM
MPIFTDGVAVYTDIVNKTRGSNVPIEFVWPGGPLKMAAHKNPYSIQPKEFDFIRSAISTLGLTTGFEIATAFGVSSLACALGFHETGGRLVTMDAYIEETVDDANAYRNANTFRSNENADGFKSVNFLGEQYGAKESLSPVIGWSPDDVEPTLSRHNGKKLDFAFIDAGHWDEALIRDAKAVAPHLGDRYLVLFHDTPSFGPVARSEINQLFGTGWTPILGLAGNRGGFDMASLPPGKENAHPIPLANRAQSPPSVCPM